MRKRITKIVIATLIFVLVAVLIIAIRLWFHFRSPEAMERMGWDHADGSGSTMIIKPNKENYGSGVIFPYREESIYRLETDCQINDGKIIINIYKLINYDKSQLGNIDEEQKKLTHQYIVYESGCHIFDMSEYEEGNYWLHISWEGNEADLTCTWILKENMYVWQKRYNQMLLSFPWLKKWHGPYGSSAGYIKD